MMAAAEAFLETWNGGEATGDEDGEEKGPNNVYIHLRVPACVRVSESACV